MTSPRPNLTEIGIGLGALAIFCLTWFLGGSVSTSPVPSTATKTADDRAPTLDEVVAEAHRIRTGGSGARNHPALDTAVRRAA